MANWLTRLLDVEVRRTDAPVEQRTSLENPQTPLSFPAEWLG
jgi:hypothetical protein